MTKSPKTEKIKIKLTLNGQKSAFKVLPNQKLLDFLRETGLKSVKNGCREGDCGMCTILLNGKPVKSCLIEMKTMDGKKVDTLESMGTSDNLHPLQQAFLETGAIQCGFCTPAQLLTSKAFLDKNKDPKPEEVRKALSNVLCRCTGYVRIVDAVLRAAAVMRGEKVKPYIPSEFFYDQDVSEVKLPKAYYRKDGNAKPLMPLVITPEKMPKMVEVGKPTQKVDGVKLVTGKPVFTDDVEPEGTLFGALLTSPHAHAIIKNIDVSKARALPGVRAVLTYKDVPRVKYATGGQSYPQPFPYDQVSLDNKVRHQGDRVAILAADTREIAEEALGLIKVDYKVLEPVLDMEEAMSGKAPVIHDEKDTEGVYDASRNIVHHIEAEEGDPDGVFAACDHVFEGEYRTPKQHHGQMEPHVCITYFDEDGPPGSALQHTGAFPRAPHHCAFDRPARQADPGDQTAHWRRFRRQTGSPAGRPVRAFDHRHRQTGAHGIHTHPGIHQRTFTPPPDPAL